MQITTLTMCMHSFPELFSLAAPSHFFRILLCFFFLHPVFRGGNEYMLGRLAASDFLLLAVHRHLCHVQLTLSPLKTVKHVAVSLFLCVISKSPGDLLISIHILPLKTINSSSSKEKQATRSYTKHRNKTPPCKSLTVTLPAHAYR